MIAMTIRNRRGHNPGTQEFHVAAPRFQFVEFDPVAKLPARQSVEQIVRVCRPESKRQAKSKALLRVGYQFFTAASELLFSPDNLDTTS